MRRFRVLLRRSVDKRLPPPDSHLRLVAAAPPRPRVSAFERSGLLRDEIRAIIAADAELDDVPVEVVYQRLLEVRPRLARVLGPWVGFRPSAFGLRDALKELQASDRLPAPGFADAVLALRLPWPQEIVTAGPPVAADFEVYARAKGIGDELDKPWPRLARDVMGALQRDVLPDVTLAQALARPATRPWAESVLVVRGGIAEACQYRLRTQLIFQSS